MAFYELNMGGGGGTVSGTFGFGIQAISTGGSGQEIFATPKFANNIDISDNQFVIKEAGTYNIICAGNGGYNLCYLYLNNSEVTSGWGIDINRSLNVGDKLHAKAVRGSAGCSTAIYISKS